MSLVVRPLSDVDRAVANAMPSIPIWISVTSLTPFAVQDFASEAFIRRDGDHYALVVINSNRDHASRTRFETDVMQVSAGDNAVLRDVLGGERHTVGGDGTLDVEVPALGAVILVPEGEYTEL